MHVLDTLLHVHHVKDSLLHVLHTSATLKTPCCTYYTRPPRLQPYLLILSSSLPDFVSLSFSHLISCSIFPLLCLNLFHCSILLHILDTSYKRPTRCYTSDTRPTRCYTSDTRPTRCYTSHTRPTRCYTSHTRPTRCYTSHTRPAR